MAKVKEASPGKARRGRADYRICRRVENARLARGLTQTQVGEQWVGLEMPLALSRQRGDANKAVNEVCCNRLVIRGVDLPALAKWLGMPVEDLLREWRADNRRWLKQRDRERTARKKLKRKPKRQPRKLTSPAPRTPRPLPTARVGTKEAQLELGLPKVASLQRVRRRKVHEAIEALLDAIDNYAGAARVDRG
jgi:hypothetical protein